jgi:hypothetical protein
LLLWFNLPTPSAATMISAAIEGASCETVMVKVIEIESATVQATATTAISGLSALAGVTAEARSFSRVGTHALW